MVEGMAAGRTPEMVESPRPNSRVPAPSVGSASGPLGDVQAADREIARQTAVRARAVAEFAASRPASDDRAQGEPGAMSAAPGLRDRRCCGR
jgi:hypothetical protein